MVGQDGFVEQNVLYTELLELLSYVQHKNPDPGVGGGGVATGVGGAIGVGVEKGLGTMVGAGTGVGPDVV